MISNEETPAGRLCLALDLYEAGVDMMRQTLKRRFSDLDDKSIEELLCKRLLSRECAPHGDAQGVPGSLERFGIVKEAISETDPK